ncbi:polysaccharide deacetylase family protein [Nonomuraea sp. NBC_01738]|uniref:polysaccharide deacetylase family protein n=1 Tax=Nonomuraea sp. NBC_01738 TaxID=2976003 RepID=UPI002E161FE7|nr:polysaccharide deacetylase family protein [Nonomuraea sp. NBC_01738]
MRAWGVPLALLLVAGCGAVRPQPMMMAAEFRPPPVVDPNSMARKLTAMQPDWPRGPRVDCKKSKCVALTFDDGPGDYTTKLLGILRERGVRATFFVVGEMVAADKHHNLRRIVDDGHELGNHSWSHAQLTALSTSGIRYQLKHTQDLVERIAGIRMTLMRPPYGSTDKRVAAETKREGLAQILWNVDTLDWRDRVPSIVAKRAGKAKAGSIILMHDIHGTTVEAVPRLLSTLEHKGYTFVTVSELYGKPPAPGREYTER